MIVMAVDAGVANIGVAVMQTCSDTVPGVQGWRPAGLYLIRTEADPRKGRLRVADDDMERVKEGMRQLGEIVESYDIKRMAVELPVAGGQSAAAVKFMALASAICAHVEVRYDLFTEWYSPGECKKCVAGKWTSSKVLVSRVIEAKYPQVAEQFPTLEQREHVIDALACFETALRLGNVCRA